LYNHSNKLSQQHNLIATEALSNFKKGDDYRARFRSECLTGSGISANLYSAAIGFIEDLGNWETHEALELPVSRFWQSKAPHNFGSLAIFYNEDGSIWQGKPETPMTGKTGKPQRYQAPKNQGSRAYLPPIPAETRKAIGDRHNIEVPTVGSFWTWLSDHPELEIIVTEGGKKSLSLLSQGYIAIAVYGVNAGYRVKDALGIPLLKPELIPDLERFAIADRPIVLAFDQDNKLETRQKVQIALSRFGNALTTAGSLVTIATWNSTQGKGVDDLITNQGVGAWETAHRQALALAQSNIITRLSSRVKRKADLNIGDREFKEITETLPTSGIVGLVGAKGSGKSEAIGILKGDRAWLSVTHRRSIGRDQAGDWDGILLQDGDRYGTQALDRNGNPVKGASVCYPSLLGAERLGANVLILDELTAGLEFILGSKLCNKNGLRPVLLTELDRRIREADLVILADADLTEDAICYIEAIRGGRAYLVRSERKPLGYAVHNLTGKKNTALAEFISQVQTIPAGKMIYLNSDSRTLIDALETELIDQNIKSLKITQETSGEDLQRRLTESKGAILPELALMGVKVILSSPSITQGFSIKHHTDRIHSRWGIYTGGSISAQDIAQAPDRIRSDAPLYLWVAERGSAYSQWGRSLNQKAWLKEFRTMGTASARLVLNSLSPEAARSVEGTDWQSENLKMLSAIEVSRNLGMMALRETVLAHLRLEGKHVQDFVSTIGTAAAKQIGKAITAAAGKLKATHAAAVEAVTARTEDEIKILEKKAEKEALSKEERLQVEKYYLAMFYRLEEVKAMDVLADRGGRSKTQIRNLERVLDAAKAATYTAESIDRNAETPQDWSKAAVQIALIERSGAGELIRGIWRGEIIQLTPEIITPICEFIQAHSEHYQRAFGWGGAMNISSMKTVGVILDWVGLKRKGQQLRIEGQRVRFYSIHLEQLEWLKGVIERRSNPVTDIQKLDLIQTSVTPLKPPLDPIPLVRNEEEIYEYWYNPPSDEVDPVISNVA
jgi:hypothetical protein